MLRISRDLVKSSTIMRLWSQMEKGDPLPLSKRIWIGGCWEFPDHSNLGVKHLPFLKTCWVFLFCFCFGFFELKKNGFFKQVSSCTLLPYPALTIVLGEFINLSCRSQQCGKGRQACVGRKKGIGFLEFRNLLFRQDFLK